MDAEAGNDLVIINDSITAGAITVNGGAGTDVVQLNGTSGNDLFYANGNQINRVGDSVVTLAADTESSVIYAGNGDDAVSVVAGLSKPLEFNGGNGSDAVAFYGTSGVDFMLFGNVGPQTGARNGDAQVYWNGQTESAVASGGDGDDVLNAYAGLGTPVTFAGGNGTDTAVYYGTNGSDLFYVSANLISLVGFQSITLGSDAELTVANGGDGNDAVSVDAGLSKPHTFVGGNGTDTVSLYGTSAGEIFLLGYWGARTGGRHGDAAYASWEPTTEAVQVSGDGGNDVLNVYAGLLTPTTFYGGGGTDTVVFYGTSNDDTYFGNNNTAARIGDALVTFDGNVEDVKFYGGAGNDTANIAVSTIVSYLFAGEAGTADVLNVTVSGYVRTNTGTGSGYYTYPNTPSYKIINFTGIES